MRDIKKMSLKDLMIYELDLEEMITNVRKQKRALIQGSCTHDFVIIPTYIGSEEYCEKCFKCGKTVYL